MKLSKVSERVYANWDGETRGNVGIVVLDNRVLVVDAQYPGSARRFREAIGYRYPELYATDRPEWQKRSWARWYQHWRG